MVCTAALRSEVPKTMFKLLTDINYIANKAKFS
jgi:hypothetical protein